ncbi:trihelix transcription factor GT-3b-like [Xyrichtys novacula]|uniref:Trihelix transcription factor GT-3b-like n=1 Tax=Xyrichtys novacula TaxID=13765 RepID=A0AAV1GXX3_XYRNO|nr:trihelix transcription factor GT-3b-like [Xyrichtys novacula]
MTELMATKLKKKQFIWTEAQTVRFIELRKTHDHLFTGDRGSAAEGFDLILKEMGLVGEVTTAQASKKWENLKKKYRDLILPRTGSGTEAGETTPGTWPYFQLMHTALGDKDSVKPLNLISTAGNPEQQPDEETPHTSSGCCSGFPATSDSSPATAPGTSGTPTPGSSKRKNEVLEYIRDYTERQDKRQRELDQKEEEREDRKEKQLDKLIGILAKLADNSK